MLRGQLVSELLSHIFLLLHRCLCHVECLRSFLLGTLEWVAALPVGTAAEGPSTSADVELSTVSMQS